MVQWACHSQSIVNQSAAIAHTQRQEAIVKLHGDSLKNIPPSPEGAIEILEHLRMRNEEFQSDDDTLFLLGYAYFILEKYPYAEVYLNGLDEKEGYILNDYAAYFLLLTHAKQKNFYEGIQGAQRFLRKYPDSLFWEEVFLLHLRMLLENRQEQQVLQGIQNLRHYRSQWGYAKRERLKRFYRREKNTLHFLELQAFGLSKTKQRKQFHKKTLEYLVSNCDTDLLRSTLSLLPQPSNSKPTDIEIIRINFSRGETHRLAESWAECKNSSWALPFLSDQEELFKRQGASPGQWFALGKSHYQIREYGKALSIFSGLFVGDLQLNARVPPSILNQALFWRAETLSRMDRFAEALTDYKNFYRAYPTDSKSDDVLFRLGLTHYYQKNYDDAQGTWLEFSKKFKRSKWHAQASWLAGFAAFRRNDFAKSIEIWESNLFQQHRLRAEARKTRYWLGRAYQESKQFSQAKAFFSDLYQKHPFSYYGLSAFAQLTALDPGAMPLQRPYPNSTAIPSDPYLSVDDIEDIEENLRENQRFLSAEKLRSLGFLAHAGREVWAIPRTKDRKQVLYLAKFLNNVGAVNRSSYVGRIYFHDDLAIPLPQTASAADISFRKSVWELGYPRPFGPAVLATADKEKINPHTIWALMRQESSFNPEAVSSAHAVGLMQVLPKTASQMLGRTITKADLLDPAFNIGVGGQYLRFLLERYQYRFYLAIAAYNAGPERVDQWLKANPNLPADVFIEDIPFRETRNYAKRVTRIFVNLEHGYNPEMPPHLITNLSPLALQNVGK